MLEEDFAKLTLAEQREWARSQYEKYKSLWRALQDKTEYQRLQAQDLDKNIDDRLADVSDEVAVTEEGIANE